MDTASTQIAPVTSPVQRIDPAWIDYNGHLNMAYYLVLFDQAYDGVAQALGMGPDYAASRRMTTYTGDARIAYLREVHQDANLLTTYRIIDHDEKRIHAFQELRHADQGWLAATSETLTLHIDMGGPKVCPFPPDVMARIDAMAAGHASLPRPDNLGRPIGIRRPPKGAR